MKLPEEFQKIITINFALRVRLKPNGVYEARFRSHGFNICVSSVDYDMLKPKFFKAVLNYQSPIESASTPSAPGKALAPVKFFDVAERWVELKRPTIKQRSLEYYTGTLRANIYPVFRDYDLKAIKQSDVKALLNKYIEEEKYRTAQKIHQTLKAIFEFAVGDELVEKSPLSSIEEPDYEEETGVAFTVDEEREFIKLVLESKCLPKTKYAMLFILYTGIRRSELDSARIEGDFVTVVTAKTRKGFKEHRRLIPITPMLAKWLPQIDLDEIKTVRPDTITQAVKRLMPEHHQHDLRHTFITRCQECEVPREVVSVWAGHVPDNTQTSKVYTHFSPEFMKKEAQKVIYNL